MIRLAVFHSSLEIGGQERSLVEFLRSLAPSSYETTLFYFKDGPLKAEIPACVRLVLLDVPKLFHFLPFFLAKYLLRFPAVLDAGNFDIAVDYSAYYVECAVGALQAMAGKRLVWVHSNFQKKLEYNARFRLLWMLQKGKFRHYDHAACVSHGAAEAFIELTGFQAHDVSIIPNIINYDEILEKSQGEAVCTVEQSWVNFAFLGRLVPVKRIDLGIDAFSRVAAKRSNVALYIIGDGPERTRLENLAKSSGFFDRIVFCGGLLNPFPTLKQMDCLLLLSDYEGQGVVVQEAMTLGLQVIAPKHLESSNDDIRGVDDVSIAMLGCGKKDIGAETANQADHRPKIYCMIKKLLGEDT